MFDRMIEAPTSRRSSGDSALTAAFVPTGMNCGVSTTPWVSVRRPSRARVVASAGGGSMTSKREAAPTKALAHASGGAGSSHRPTMPGSDRRGGGIS